jgi:hypothetical protein
MNKIVILVISLFSVASMAAKWGDAGCGLGMMVMGKDGNQILASTTNGTGTQSFGITSGTSGCVEDGAVAQQVPLYIEVNKATLAKEAARGEGETLAGLAQLLGCKQEVFGPAMKSNYNQIFMKSEMAPNAIRSSIQKMVEGNPAGTCGA